MIKMARPSWVMEWMLRTARDIKPPKGMDQQSLGLTEGLAVVVQVSR
jgi:hypothetical protein